MEIVFGIFAVLFVIALGFGGKEKPSDLPPFTKKEAEQYMKDFDYWNRR